MKRKLKKKRNSLFILPIVLFLLSLSCTKEEGLTATEQSIADDAIIVEYLKTHKLDTLTTIPPNKINWTIEAAVEGDETLMEIVDSVVEYTFGGVPYKYYYIDVEVGSGVEATSNEILVADFNEYLLDERLISTSNNKDDAMELDIATRIPGIRHGINVFFPGKVPEELNNYRNDTDTPGRGILFFPSGLGYKDIGNEEISPNQPLRVDMVLYTRMDYDN